MSDYALTFGERLKLMRQAQGLTAEDLAVRSGLTQGYISKLECGYHPYPRTNTVKKLAEVLNVSAAELLFDESVVIKEIIQYMPKEYQVWLTQKNIFPYLELAMELQGMNIPAKHVRKMALLYLEMKEDLKK